MDKLTELSGSIKQISVSLNDLKDGIDIHMEKMEEKQEAQNTLMNVQNSYHLKLHNVTDAIKWATLGGVIATILLVVITGFLYVASDKLAQLTKNDVENKLVIEKIRISHELTENFTFWFLRNDSSMKIVHNWLSNKLSESDTTTLYNDIQTLMLFHYFESIKTLDSNNLLDFKIVRNAFVTKIEALNNPILKPSVAEYIRHVRNEDRNQCKCSDSAESFVKCREIFSGYEYVLRLFKRSTPNLD